MARVRTALARVLRGPSTDPSAPKNHLMKTDFGQSTELTSTYRELATIE